MTLFLLKDFKGMNWDTAEPNAYFLDGQLKEYKYFRENNTCVKRVETRPFHKSCVKSNHHRKFEFTLGLGYPAVLYEWVGKTHIEAASVSKHDCAPISYVSFFLLIPFSFLPFFFSPLRWILTLQWKVL
jgi:hypothetical protein